MRYRIALVCLALSLVAAPEIAQAQSPSLLDSTTLDGFKWRSVGPANMGGRITDIEGIASPSRTFFVAAATGGIWKTTNAGTTFRPVFDTGRVISMGDIAIAPSDTNIIWAGTGEEDSRNSISPGGGIYKSIDGGLTWEFKGLAETQQIGRIVIHPDDPDIVYVAALGHIWGPNKERGLYRTKDGGETWQLIKFISDRAGFVDVAMDPGNPDVLFASSWERVRGPYFLKSGGPGGDLWSTKDGGETWTRVEGGGFPGTRKGRIGIAIAPSNSEVVYALVEAAAPEGSSTRLSGLYRSTDGAVTWQQMNTNNSRPFYYSQVRVDPGNPDRVYWSSTPVNFSDDGGKTVRNATIGVHVDHHAMWIDPNDPAHFVVGNDGGIAQTWDRGGNYEVLNIMPLGQFYEVSYGMGVPYRVCGGLQDNGSWCGPSRLASGSITNHDWYRVNGGDGFFTQQDPYDSDVVYAESQGGNIARIELASGVRTSLQKPGWRDTYTMYEDSIILDWPDTTVKLRGSLRKRIEVLRKRQEADSVALYLRWNWNTPFLISPHSPNTLYAGANRVLKSTRRGAGLFPISPDLTTRDEERIRVSTRETGGITPDVTGAETYSTITALAESPLKPGLLYVGTDDGNVWMTRNDGGNWENLTSRFPGMRPKSWVSRIEPSHHDTATFYVAFDNHRDDDFNPYIFVSADYGRTFRSIANDLPAGGPDFVHVIREDPQNPDLLFAGTDVGVYASLDRGKSWQRFMTGLPTVPVHDLQIHPRDRELIAGTHGRSIWIVDIAPLEELNSEILAADAYLFTPKTAYQFGDRPTGGESAGQQSFSTRSAPYGAEFVYRLSEGSPRSQVNLVITDIMGDTLSTIRGAGGPGIHRVQWNLRGKRPEPEPLSPAQQRDSVRFVRRVDMVFDSLAEAGMNEQMLSRLKQNILSGNTQSIFRRFGRFGNRNAGEGFAERPAESSTPGAGRGRRGPGARGRAPGGQGGQGGQGGGAFPDRNVIRQIFRRLRSPGARGFAIGFRNREQAPLVDTGDYLVSLTVGDRTIKRMLRVQRTGGRGSRTVSSRPE